MNGTGPGGTLSTLTHARLRLAQGDLAGARGIVEAMLAADPVHAEARALLAQLGERVPTTFSEPEEETLPPPEAGDARNLRAGFRLALGGGAAMRARAVNRLAAWIGVVERNRGRIRVR